MDQYFYPKIKLEKNILNMGKIVEQRSQKWWDESADDSKQFTNAQEPLHILNTVHLLLHE